MSNNRVLKYLSSLKTIKRYFLKNFIKPTNDDVRNAIFKIQTSKYTDNTKRDFIIALKAYLNWLNQNSNISLDISWIKVKHPKEKLPEILTKEDIQKIIEATDNTRDRALVYVLYEGGLRAGELLNMNTVFGKTGSRRVRLIASKNIL